MMPEWYDRKKLVRAFYADGYTGWVIDLGDGTCRFANAPLLGCDDESNPRRDEINANAPRYGDRVRLIRDGGALPRVDATEILERYMRPDENDPAIRGKALDKMLGYVLSWLGKDGEGDEASVRDQLSKVLESHWQNGYEYAKDLESRFYWTPDPELVETLDGWSSELDRAHSDAVRKWVKECDVKPPHPPGTRVRCKWGRDIVEGVIQHETHDYHLLLAEYVIRTDKHDAKSGAIVKYEDVLEVLG